MDEKLQAAYDALQAAHEAGNTEDATKIADYIETLKSQPAKEVSPVVEKESPEIMGGLGATAGAIGAVGDILYSKGRPLIRMAEKAMGVPQDAPTAPRKFLDPATVTQNAITRRTVPDIPEGSTTTIRNWTTGKPNAGTGQHAGEFLGGSDYSDADKIAKSAKEFEAKNPGQKILPGSLLAVPEKESAHLSKQRAELNAMEDLYKQLEVNQLGQNRAERLAERNRLKLKESRANALKGTANMVGKGVLPIVGGYEAGAQGAQAYNRLSRDDLTPTDKLSGGLNVLGAASGAASMAPGRLRIPLAILSQLSGTGANMVDKRNPRNEKAEGGVVQHYVKGGKVLEEVGKSISAKGAAATQKDAPLWLKNGYDPVKIGKQYPDVIPPVLAKDPKTGKEFYKKANSPEALAVQKARNFAQKQIDAGNYSPHFDVNQRYYADPSYYPTAGKTLTDIVPKKADTIAKYTELANDPEALARLRGAFEKAKDRPAAKDWYAMGQLEDAFIKELGPVEGRKQFKARFADAMAATTGGADPNSNLMMAAFTNYQKALGKDIPTKAADLPFPVGGRFVSGNMEQANKLAQLGQIPVTNPKRHNFSANFLGHRDVSTLDEQMSQLWDPKMMTPPPNAYGIYEKALAGEAKKAGVNPVNFQDIAWAGAKDYPGKAMMTEINEMLARTSKMTGQSQEDVLKGFIHGNKPMYGVGALSVGQAATQDDDTEGHRAGGKIGALESIGKAILPTAERQANKARFLEKSKTPNVMYHGTAADISEFAPKQAGSIFLSPTPKFAGEFSDASENYLAKDMLKKLNTENPDKFNSLKKSAISIANKKGTQWGDELETLARNQLPTRANIMPVHVNATNPFDFQDQTHLDALKNELLNLNHPDIPKFDPNAAEKQINYLRGGNWSEIESPPVQQAIKNMGHDSFWVNEGGQKNLGVYDPRQIKSSIGNEGTYDPLDPNIMKADGGSIQHYAGGRKVIKAALESLEPKSTVKAYKLFRTDPKVPDSLYPLFVNANEQVPLGKWVNATAGTLTDAGKVKSKIGDLAYRPGWHAGEMPVASHIGGKSDPTLKAPDYRPGNQVWAEVEMPNDVDWQSIANQRAQLNKAGKPISRTAHITDQLPEGGHYRYKTNPNMTGDWLIGGSMKVNKVLTDDEVKAINEAMGVSDLPRIEGKADGGAIEGYGDTSQLFMDQMGNSSNFDMSPPPMANPAAPAAMQPPDPNLARQYNVGNLRPGNFTYPGQIGLSPGKFAMFQDPESGLKALEHDIQVKLNRGVDTPQKFINIYAPPARKGGDNSNKAVQTYINNVSTALGIKPGERIPNTPEAVKALREAIIKQEGAHKATSKF